MIPDAGTGDRQYRFELARNRGMTMVMSRKFTVSILFLAVILLCAAGTPSQTPLNQKAADVYDVTNVLDAGAWHKVNASPYYIASQVNVLCAAPTAATIADQRASNPHAAAAITVFVNRTGTDAMLSPSPQVFPEGSVIVKKKVNPRSDTDTALLYTVMVKHAPGYNPDAGDWEFIVVAADGRTVQARGALANCIACHQPQKNSDFVFRTYLGN